MVYWNPWRTTRRKNPHKPEFVADKILPILTSLSIFRSHLRHRSLQDRYYGNSILPDHAFAGQDGFSQAGGHFRIPVDHRQQKSQVLLGAAQVIAQGSPPLLAIG